VQYISPGRPGNPPPTILVGLQGYIAASSQARHPTTRTSTSSLLLSSLELSDTHSLWALNTSPPRNRRTTHTLCIHTGEYDPLIKSQLASMRLTSGPCLLQIHVTLQILMQRNPRTPPCDTVGRHRSGNPTRKESSLNLFLKSSGPPCGVGPGNFHTHSLSQLVTA